MALNDVLKSIGNGLGEEVKEFKSIIRRIRLAADTSALGANFRKFGPSFGTYDFDAFVQKARDFYLHGTGLADPLFTVYQMPDHKRVAIDYNGEIRGIFTRRGKPIAFFRPNFRESGYANKAAELADFRKGKNILFS